MVERRPMPHKIGKNRFMSEYQPKNPHYVDRIRQRFNVPVIRDLFGMKEIVIAPGEVHLGIDLRPELGHAPGWFQGSVTSAIAEIAAGLAALSLIEPDWESMTLDQTINFVGPARGERLVAKARVIKPGRTITVCQCEVYTEKAGVERLCAVMLQTTHSAPPAAGAGGG